MEFSQLDPIAQADTPATMDAYMSDQTCKETCRFLYTSLAFHLAQLLGKPPDWDTTSTIAAAAELAVACPAPWSE
jgi:hypothetical protein